MPGPTRMPAWRTTQWSDERRFRIRRVGRSLP